MTQRSTLRPGDIAILPDDLDIDPIVRSGRVTGVKGTVARTSLPDAHVGEAVRIRRCGGWDLEGEVVGFDEAGAIVMPYGRLHALSADSEVVPLEAVPAVPCGEAVRGRVIDALARPLDGRGEIVATERAPLNAEPPGPMDRRAIETPLSTGVRAIDAFLTVGRGQRLAIAAAAGVGKSTLLGALIKNARADRVVIALIGERGNEPADFVYGHLDDAARERATVVVSTSDQSPLLRLRAAYVATAIAEAARDHGEDVLLLMDSVTRFVRALRDVGQAVGEPIGRGGLPASTTQVLAQLLERAGNDAHGTLTAFYTVLAENDELDDPVVEEAIALLDGHIVLSREIQQRKRFPAIDVLASVSRRMADVTEDDHRGVAERVLSIAAEYRKHELPIKLGDYAGALSAAEMIRRNAELEAFLQQDFRAGDAPTLDETVQALTRRFAAW